MKFTTATLLLISSSIFIIFSCKNDDSPRAIGEVQFSINPLDISTGRTEAINALDDADRILITIEKEEGSTTDYSLSAIELYKLNGQFITEKISLPPGAYFLTEFIVIDSEDNITHIAPLEGSEQAQNVNSPLPIPFTILPFEAIEVTVEVLSSEFLDLEDFGLVGFNLTEINLFRFFISVSPVGETTFLNASLTVQNSSYNFSKELDATASNSITIRDGYSEYQVSIESDGYNAYSYTFSPDSLYYYSTNPLIVELTQSTEDLVDPRDGRVYKTVQIGGQIWMAENLKASLYNDGSPIEYPGTDIEAWEANTSGAYALYDNEETTYGHLYNWYAVNTGKLCPTGWHIPSDSEWTTLSTYLGGESVAGGKMKATSEWTDPNTGASNSSGFTAYPAGWAYYVNGHYSHRGSRAAFWSSEEGIDADHGISRQIDNDSEALVKYASSNSSNKGNGFSCRCIKD